MLSSIEQELDKIKELNPYLYDLAELFKKGLKIHSGIEKRMSLKVRGETSILIVGVYPLLW